MPKPKSTGLARTRERQDPHSTGRDPTVAAAAARVGGPPGRRATINDIARLANVSKKTVSRVINQSPFVKDETRARIDAVIQQAGYSPDPQARGLAFRRAFLIGLVYDNPNPQYVVQMQDGALDALRGSGFELVVHPCERDSPGFVAGVRGFIERQKLHGVILTPPVSEDPVLARAIGHLDCHCVRIASVRLDPTARMIVSHERAAAAEAAAHLADLGHTLIGFIAGPAHHASSHERQGGFLAALAARGLSVAPRRLVAGAYTFESGIACAEQLLTVSPRPTAIFASNDEMAAGVYKAAFRLKIAIPEQLSVVGFDDTPLASRLTPALTTIRLPIREMGRLAAARLIPPGVAEDTDAALTSPVTPHLVVRDSTGPLDQSPRPAVRDSTRPAR